MDAILPVYKPVGMTSFDVIRQFKRAVHPDFKVGHGGTLDPFAEGVLLLLLGKATKKMSELSTLPKTYLAKAKLGASSDTLDCTGIIIPGVKGTRTPGVLEIRKVAKKFVGEIEQQIPDYSATKVGGVPRYQLARQGLVIPSKSKKVMIYSIEVLGADQDQVEMRIKCGSGTYIRQLAYDLMQTLGVESYLSSLSREQIGEISLDQCLRIEEIAKWQNFVR